MMPSKFPDPGRYNNWRDWARDTVKAANQTSSLREVMPQVVLLEYLTSLGVNSAAVDGLMMYDPVLGVPVFSRNGEWVPMAQLL